MEVKEINELGKRLELYTAIDYIGRGFPTILPRGAKVIKLIRNYVEDMEEGNNYKVVRTPSMSNVEIYKIEDRYELEKNELFVIKDDKAEGNAIVLKPYVEPFHCAIFQQYQHSYKELPVKYCETSTVFRNERDLKGILKTRQITLSDASVFCEPTKIFKEIRDILLLQQQIIDKLGLDEVTYTISTWNTEHKEDYIGTIDEWNSATDAMKAALDDLNIPYKINQRSRMYGPAIKIQYNNEDLSSVQIDFEITHRFDLKYTDKDNQDKFPIYMHHTVVGSYEKLLGFLIEKYQGDFPFWIAPVQAVVMYQTEEFKDYAIDICNELNKSLRATIDNSMESFDNKMVKQQNFKIPFIVVVGKTEMNSKKIKVFTNESHSGYQVRKNLDVKEFIKEVEEWQKQL